MDKISLDEIKRAVKKYEKKENENSANVNQDPSNTKNQKNIANNSNSSGLPDQVSSSEFRQFEDENKAKIHSWYEKWAKFCGKIIKISPGKNQVEKLKEALFTANLNLEPADTFSFAMLGPVIYMFAGILITFLLLKGDLFFMSFFLLSGIGMIIPLTNLPYMLANIRRLQSSKEIVLCVFYIVTYMRQNSNLEKAIQFSAEHLTGPLASDLKKILWDVETEKFQNIHLSLTNYLTRWKKTNAEFLEGMNLIESSLFEPKEENRLALLDKALDVILTETYEKMLHYTHKIQSPISTLHMLGIILPILGLVILPLVVSFMENVAWYHIAVLYNIVIPVSVYFVSKNILSTRPGGYGSGDISEEHPDMIKAKEKKKKFLGITFGPESIGLVIGFALVLLGLTPLFLHAALGDGNDIRLFQNDYDANSGLPVLEYRQSQTLDGNGNPVYKGPYGLIAALFGLFIPLGFGLGIGLYYKIKTKDFIIIRQKTAKLEQEFGSAVFQLGNRLGDGIPLEMAFTKVTEVIQDSESSSFFKLIDQNIRKLGMSIDQAIFDNNSGAIIFFPSNIIRSTMKVLTEAIKKGPLIASHAMINIARYVKEMHAVEERLKDLLADVISSMKSLVRFLAPVISGIVVGITSMITSIIGNLSSALERFGSGAEQAGALQGLTDMFGDGIPTYHFQIVVGMYIVQIVFIVAQTISGIGNGDDAIGEKYTTAKYLISSVTLYVIIAALVMIIFNTIALSILGDIVNADVI